MICKVTAMTEVESRQEGHVANDESKSDISDVQACQPEVSHVPELAAIVLTWFISWWNQQVSNLRVLDSYCPPKIKGPEKGAAGSAEGRDCRPGTAC